MTYLEGVCYSCEVALMVASHDASSRNYCQTCAWNKLGAIPPAIAGREE